eukprot:SAG22_NODE_265_length_13348_cov_150.719149_3_plen_132_part_00
MMHQPGMVTVLRLAALSLAAGIGSRSVASAAECSSTQEDCNLYLSRAVYNRTFPTWMFMGMPLVIRADQDTDVRIVARSDVQTAHCFTHCARGEAPSGYHLTPQVAGKYATDRGWMPGGVHEYPGGDLTQS